MARLQHGGGGEMIRPFAPTPDHAVMPASEPESAALELSDFEKVGDLGEGACGVVTKVRHRGSGAVFALNTAYYSDPNSEEEVAVLRRVGGSPHLVRCHAIFRGADEEPAMLLELMDASSLGRVLRHRDRYGRRGLPEPALAEVATRCLAGLAHLHYLCGVAHLDIKPDNLLSDSSGHVRIGDFSVSRIFSRVPGERLRVSIGVGSTAYMSPERFAPNARPGPRGACAADVWSLGVTVLELFLRRVTPEGLALRVPPPTGTCGARRRRSRSSRNTSSSTPPSAGGGGLLAVGFPMAALATPPSPQNPDHPPVLRDKLLFLQELLRAKCVSPAEFNAAKRPLVQRLAALGVAVDCPDADAGRSEEEHHRRLRRVGQRHGEGDAVEVAGVGVDELLEGDAVEEEEGISLAIKNYACTPRAKSLHRGRSRVPLFFSPGPGFAETLDLGVPPEPVLIIVPFSPMQDFFTP